LLLPQQTNPFVPVSSDDCRDRDGGAKYKHRQIADVVELHRCRAIQNWTARFDPKVLIKNHKGASSKKCYGGAEELKFFHGAFSGTRC
jgi:hypothetical protein